MERIINSRIFDYEFVEFKRLAKQNGTSPYKLVRKFIRDYLALQNKTPKPPKHPESLVC